METETGAYRHLQQAYTFYEDENDVAQSLQECEIALAIDPFLADAHNLRGILLEESGHSLQAIGAYRNALNLDPNFTEVAENLDNLKAEFAVYSKLVTIARFSFPTEAYIPKTKLEAEGIWSIVIDEEMITANWLYSNAIGGVKLQVKQDDAGRALTILDRAEAPLSWDETELGQADADELCPKCDSLSIHYEKYATRWLFLSWLILQFPLPIFKRKWACTECGHVWKL